MPQENALDLDVLRNTLIRQEETIIFSFIERAQFKLNPAIYEPNALSVPDFDGSFCDFFLFESEILHAKVRRYTSPDEHAFFPEKLPRPVLPLMEFPKTIAPNNINFNPKIYSVYKQDIVTKLCAPGNDSHYGSSAIGDVTSLQALSKRIHYGKFIAEAKFSEDPEGYSDLIRRKDSATILEKLTNQKVEDNLLMRVRKKSATYGQDISHESISSTNFKVDPELVVSIYRDIIIPLTKEVEVVYLLGRLGPQPNADD